MLIANIASFPARVATMTDVVRRLAAQVDRVNLALNEYGSIPERLKALPNVHAVIPSSDLKDLGKFISATSDQDFVVLADDDIPYPEDYVQVLLSGYQRYSATIGRKCVVGYHGTIYADLFSGDQLQRNVFCYWEGLDKPRLVNQLGTGTVGFPASLYPPFEFMAGSAGFVDVRFARYCFEKSTSMVALPRAASWINREFADVCTSSLFETFTKRWPAHVIREVQHFGGYGRLDLEAYLKLQ